MNKLLLSTILFLLGYQANAQDDFAIGAQDHPFFRIIEWKGKGGLLMSRNPKDFMNQINLTLVAEKGMESWEQKFNPKIREPFYLFNEGTRHVYFLNNLDLVDNGRSSFNQMNSGGNVKSKVLDVGIKVKRLPNTPDYNKFKCVNAAVTVKTLVYQHRLYNKKEKEHEDYAVFMTHHNMSHLVFPLGPVSQKDIESDKGGLWKYNGFNGDIVYFGRSRLKAGILGWTIKGYSSKGAAVEDHFLVRPKNLRSFRDIGYGNVGAGYITDEKVFTNESGLVSYIDGHFYLLAIQERNGGNELVLFQDEGEEWTELNAIKLGPIDDKEFVDLGSFPIKEGITYHYRHMNEDVSGILFFEKGKGGAQAKFNEHSIYNPSALFIDHKESEFVTKAPDGRTLSFDRSQFNRGSAVNFHYK